MKDKKYIIIEKNEVGMIDFSEVMQTNVNTLRWNGEGTKTFVKYKGDQPDFVFEITNDLIGKTEYSHREFLKVLEAW
jgi:hypothetical protein